MAMRRGPRLQVGSAAWIAEERDSALSIARSEIDEFSFSARNEMDWLNEHMAEIFSENQMNVAELFKTPGKLRGKTPRTARKAELGTARVPLSHVFSATPKGAPNPFTLSNVSQPRSPRFQVAEDMPGSGTSASEGPAKPAVVHPPHQVEARAPNPLADSGYHGSQTQETVPFDNFDKDVEMPDSPEADVQPMVPAVPLSDAASGRRRPSAVSAEATVQLANTEQAGVPSPHPTAETAPAPSAADAQPSSPFASQTRLPIMSPRSPSPTKTASSAVHSPPKPSSPLKSSSPQKSAIASQQLPTLPRMPGLSSPQDEYSKTSKDVTSTSPAKEHGKGGDDAADADEAPSPSDASSPIRPLMRKSSLNFASLPAREPLASKKSLGGARMSRTSQLDSSRQSYYNRHTGGKSLGGAMRQELADGAPDEMDVDDELTVAKEDADSRITAHSKSYTQRLHDQISMLGKSQSAGARTSKSIANLLPSHHSAPPAQTLPEAGPASDSRKISSPKPKRSVPAPGAYPEEDDDDDDDDDDWIAPPTTAATGATSVMTSPGPAVADPHSSAVVEVIAGNRNGIAGASESTRSSSRPGSPAKASSAPQRTPKHGKSASVPTLPTTDQLDADSGEVALKKTISISNPALSTVAEDDLAPSPPKSPTRSFRESPLKQVKKTLSSLLKSSKSLIASSAAISAEGKSSLLQSPSSTRLGYHPEPSVESFKTADNVVYPDLSQQLSATSAPLSPVRTNSSRRTRASAERERREAKEREKEEKERQREREREMREAKRYADKLEKAREKEREKARVFSKEQEKAAAAEGQPVTYKEQDRPAAPEERRDAAHAAQAGHPAQAQPLQGQSQEFRTAAPPPRAGARSPAKPTRTTPRRTKGEEGPDGKGAGADADELDAEMAEAAAAAPPQSIPRPTTASSMRAPGTKRPTKPTKDTVAKQKQAPTVIRVNTTGSQQKQFHPSNSMAAGPPQETLGQQPGSARLVNGKASQGSLHAKPSLPSLASSASSASRPRALEQAAKRKEQEEREAQQKREAKLEAERKRAAADEQRRQEQQRRAEAERQKEEERKRAIIEKAKQTRAPPPAVRTRPNGAPEHSAADKAPVRPPSRLGSTMHQEGRLVNAVLLSNAKGATKRPLQHDAAEESSGAAQRQQRAPAAAPAQEAKRMRLSEEFDEDIDMVDSHHNQRIIKGPPVRPSGGFKKDLPTNNGNNNSNNNNNKSMFSSGYSNVPQPGTAKDVFKTTGMGPGQHSSQAKAMHPRDMARFSKGTIPFAPNPNQAGPAHHHHKTPARPAGGAVPKSAKSAARSSPRFPNGESIELPDIQTDDESDEDEGHGAIAPWANSPALKRALLEQERIDPMQVFGPPGPLIMEEVFSKAKDRFPKFRARTSSANWSGTDRLTEEDIRKDQAARDKMRREGGWSYELSREVS